MPEIKSLPISDLKQAGLIVVDRNGVRANEETLLL